MNPLGLDSQNFEEFPEEDPAAPGVVVPRVVVAIPRMAAGDQNGIGADFKRLDDQVEVDPSGTRKTDDADVRRVFEPVRPCQVGAEIGAPIADERDDFRLKRLICVGFLHLLHAFLYDNSDSISA